MNSISLVDFEYLWLNCFTFPLVLILYDLLGKRLHREFSYLARLKHSGEFSRVWAVNYPSLQTFSSNSESWAFLALKESRSCACSLQDA